MADPCAATKSPGPREPIGRLRRRIHRGPAFVPQGRVRAMEILRFVVFGVPIGAWVAGVFFILPAGRAQGGCAGMGTVVNFLCLAVLGMTACLGPSIYLAVRSKRPADLVAVALNLSWLIVPLSGRL
ncbi:MAG: hypothetical protein BGO49_31050 [Planctomycetales bacterium 71-10]|nr:MAG: hypothetical protein BGO49_31050 [Planctomycetales bacterium 71-10]